MSTDDERRERVATTMHEHDMRLQEVATTMIAAFRDHPNRAEGMKVIVMIRDSGNCRGILTGGYPNPSENTDAVKDAAESLAAMGAGVDVTISLEATKVHASLTSRVLDYFGWRGR